jgi:hypothetical protein
MAMLSEMGDKGKRVYGSLGGDIYNVYVGWWSPPVLCIGGMTITSGFEQV